MVMTSTNFEVQLFDGKNNFSLQQSSVKDILVQQGLSKALLGNSTKPATMFDGVWEQLEIKVVSTIHLSLINTVSCPPSICMLDPKNSKKKKNHFLTKGPREYLNHHGLSYLGIKVLTMTVQVKMSKMLVVNRELAEGQDWSKLHQNNIFHAFISNPRLLELFINFDQISHWVDFLWRPRVEFWSDCLIK